MPSKDYFFPNLNHWTRCKDEACELYGENEAEILKNELNCSWRDVLNVICMEITRKMASTFVDEIINGVLQVVSDTNPKPRYNNKFIIKDEFQKNPILLEKLKRYQISSDSDDSIFKFNSIVHAIKQLGLFDENILEEMNEFQIENDESIYNYFTRFGKQYKLNFRIVRFSEKQKRWYSICDSNKILGDDEGVRVELAMIDSHFMLNEVVEGVASYALKNYREIDENCKKDDKFKLAITEQQNHLYKSNSKKSHIKSYELVNLTTIYE